MGLSSPIKSIIGICDTKHPFRVSMLYMMESQSRARKMPPNRANPHKEWLVER
jgi:hypothetical protein